MVGTVIQGDRIVDISSCYDRKLKPVEEAHVPNDLP